MGWPKGKPRPEGAGRKKGTPNRNSLKVEDILLSLKFEPIAELVKIVEATQFDRPDVCAKICLGLAEFIHPKRKAVEHSGEVNTNPYMDKTLKELEGILKERMEKK